MIPVRIDICSRQPDGETLHFQTTGGLQRRSDKLHLYFSVQTDATLPAAAYRLIYWREGLAFLETDGATSYRFRLEEGKRTQATMTVHSLSAPVTVQTNVVEQKDLSSHGILRLHYRLYTGQALLNENDIALNWETQ